MSTLYVRATGTDSGSGSMDDPYRTIAKAASEWLLDDIIDVGEGTFIETVALAFPNERNVIKGAGHRKSVVVLSVPGGIWFTAGSNLIERLAIQDLQITQGTAGLVPFRINNCNANARFTVSRCLFLMTDAHTVEYAHTSATPRFDLLNCVFASKTRTSPGGNGF